MKYSRNAHSLPICKDYELTKFEYKVLDFYLSYGRAWVTLAFLLSLFFIPWMTIKCWPILSEYILLLLIWFVFIIIASVYALPILVFTVKCLVLALFQKEKAVNCQILGAALFGWDRSYQKSGRKDIIINKASDIWDCDESISEFLIKYTIEQLSYFNNKINVEPKYRVTCYNCFFDAAYDAGIIRKEYCKKGKLRPVVIEQFLTYLGNEYQLSAQNFSRKVEQMVYTADKICTYETYKKYIKSNIDKLLSDSKIK